MLESNGSSSMATVCASSLSLMDAGVPIKAACAGVAMGLIKEGDRVAVLTDILGLEDALGDMDFKVAGTRKGVTSIQMDIKIEGLSFEIMQEALKRANKGRMHILDLMDQALAEPRSELSDYAPRIVSIQINPEKIGEIIGPKGKTIRAIQDESGATIDIDDSGLVKIAAVSGEAGARAREMIEAIVAEPEVGRIYEGPVKNTTTFGAFVEIMPGTEGLCHISELPGSAARRRPRTWSRRATSSRVKLLSIDEKGRLRLSRQGRHGRGRGRRRRRPRRPPEPRPEAIRCVGVPGEGTGFGPCPLRLPGDRWRRSRGRVRDGCHGRDRARQRHPGAHRAHPGRALRVGLASGCATVPPTTRPRSPGLSHLLEHMVFKGTRRRSAHEIALSLESLGGSLDAYTSREHTSYQARVLDRASPRGPGRAGRPGA